MIVRKLIEKLQEYPSHMEVFLAERKSDFAYGLLNSVHSREIPFMEDPDGPELNRDTVIILDEE
ncbi:hypothetical protein [Christiangramia sp.]|uniref:hypothetical protein n=1 Tax=Christiangramia sp. TaxID=1931228 RepID=UPI0026336337|nr:hypothetical protein [Christiangramia sp.]